MQKKKRDRKDSGMTRRNFLSVGGAAVAGSTLAMNTGANALESRLVQTGGERIRGFKTLGRTGFQVSDLGVGGVPLRDSAVVRYAYEKGINYIDVAEGYGRGAAEDAVGEAMQFMDRSKIFITTKIRVGNNDTVETVIDRFNQCMARMKTSYVDAFYMHGIPSVEALSTPVFHTATDQLKADGRIKFIGFSSHSPGRGSPDSIEDIIMAGATDGRFDVVLFTYNFMTSPEWAEKALKTLYENGVGVTGMKTSPGGLKPQPFDPDNLTESQSRAVERGVSSGRQTREQAIERLQGQLESQERTYQNTKPFIDKYGVQSQEQLRLASIHWVAQNPLMSTACVGMNDLDIIDKIVPLSGRPLPSADEAMLQDYKVVLNDKYCRHGCNECAGSCPQGLQVSTIMRYAYYFEHQGREKAAMEQYLALDDGTALNCIGCRAPCNGACPHGINVQATMLQAHNLLTL